MAYGPPAASSALVLRSREHATVVSDKKEEREKKKKDKKRKKKRRVLHGPVGYLSLLRETSSAKFTTETKSRKPIYNRQTYKTLKSLKNE